MPGKLLSKVYGGINANATRLNIGDTEAESIVNWDIGLDGSITRRLGSNRLTSLGTPACHIGKFNLDDGTEVFVAVAGNAIWRSTDLTNWTDVTGSVSVTATSGFVGCAYKSRYYIANGVDDPFTVGETGDAETMKARSILDPPDTCTVVPYVAGAVQFVYVVTAVTPRGETKGSGVSNVSTLNPTDAVNCNTIFWTPVAGASSHRVYAARLDGASSRGGLTAAIGALVCIGEVDGTTGTFVDAGGNFKTTASNAFIYCPTVNTAYLTPGDWDANGQPYGFVVIARGRDERLLAWRGNTIWASGLGDALNWLTPNDAFVWTLQAGRDNRISAIGNLGDYTLVFTRTDGFLYTGASAGTITLEKVIPIGCSSHNGIVPVGDDLYFPSQYGPTSMKRVVSGQDVLNTTNFNNRIQPLYFATAREYWDRIVGYVMPANNRVVWWVPGASQTHNTYGLVYQYDIGAWSSYDTWTPVSVVTTATGAVYGLFNDGYVWQMHTGYSDNGSAITATYSTGHLDLNNWDPRKRIPWIDVIADRSVGNYSFNVYWNFDMGRQSWGPVQCTANTTDGNQVIVTSNNTTQHRVFTPGIGNTVQITFIANSIGQNVKIIGYGTEVRPLGKR